MNRVRRAKPVEGAESRPWSELTESGLLWLINRVVFHPRGFALGINEDGWTLQGEGKEVWAFEIATDEEKFLALKKTLEQTARMTRERRL